MVSDSSVVVRFGLTQRANVVFLIANLVGTLLYLWLSSFSWVIPEEKGLNSMTAEPFIWAMAVLPVVAVAFLINLCWAAIILRRRQWSGGRLWLAVAVTWVVAIAIDFAHH